MARPRKAGKVTRVSLTPSHPSQEDTTPQPTCPDTPPATVGPSPPAPPATRPPSLETQGDGIQQPWDIPELWRPQYTL